MFEDGEARVLDGCEGACLRGRLWVWVFSEGSFEGVERVGCGSGWLKKASMRSAVDFCGVCVAVLLLSRWLCGSLSCDGYSESELSSDDMEWFLELS
jgi:hypothetical protein